MTSRRKELKEKISVALPKTSLRFGSATPITELYCQMEIEDSRTKKRRVLDLLLSGAIPGIILTSTSSHIRIAINSPIWVENGGRRPIYIPIKYQKNEVKYE